MTMQRITISIPKHLYEDLLFLYGKGNVSKVATEAIRHKILKKKLEPKDPIDAFMALRKITPKLSDSKIMDAIRKGRT